MDIHAPKPGDEFELEDAFIGFLEEIKPYYESEQIQESYSWYRQESLESKITDPTRFFRIIRDEFGRVIAYFESKQHSEFPQIQVIQWFFVDPKDRQNGILKNLMEEFEEWCKVRGYTTIWSFSALRNEVPQLVHENLFSDHDIADFSL